LGLDWRRGSSWPAALSLVVVIYRVTRPRVAVLGAEPGTPTLHDVERHPLARTVPGVIIVRVDAPLFYANADYVEERLQRIEEASGEAVTAVVLDASGIDDLDSTADHHLRTLVKTYHDRGVSFLMVSIKSEVRAVMDASVWPPWWGPRTSSTPTSRCSGGWPGVRPAFPR